MLSSLLYQVDITWLLSKGAQQPCGVHQMKVLSIYVNQLMQFVMSTGIFEDACAQDVYHSKSAIVAWISVDSG